MEANTLPGVTLDPKDEAGLEAAFGITSNADELIKLNRQRYTAEERATNRKEVNEVLTDQVYDLDDDGNRLAVKSKVHTAVGVHVETAAVRGSGRAARISYTYISDRGSVEKGVIAYDEVFGTARERRAAKATGGGTGETPEAAAQAAADATLKDAETKAAEALETAQAEAQKAVSDAQAKAEKLLRDAEQEAAEVREAAAAEAAKNAESAKTKAESAKAKAARKGSSG